VDPNPAQLALSRLKLKLLVDAEIPTRLALLGHATIPHEERRKWLLEALDSLGLAAGVLGPTELVAKAGPDYAGRYERLFLALRSALEEHAAEVNHFLRLSSTEQQPALVSPETPLGQALDAALARVMALPNLVGLFGEEATQNPVQAFDRHFAERVRAASAAFPAARNPYLWQMLLGRYPDGFPVPWLAAPQPKTLPPVSWECAFMLPVLTRASGGFDFVHLSNILDWLSPRQAAETLEHASTALGVGGCVLVRQLNSSLDIPALGPQFRWDIDGARELHRRDRSFFYRALHLGLRR
jgi:S-adenosylmethionine-diacylglycerol 3-amino-3-carboxypropyl transferase